MQCWRESKYSMNQLCTQAGIGNWASFWIRVEWRTESNAFEKSSPIKWTYSWSCNNKEILCTKLIIAAVVEPVGRKANWSLNRPVWFGWINTGYRNFLMINRSRSLHRTEVTEMGRKSEHFSGCFDLGTGVMMLNFHCSGIYENDIDWLKMKVIGWYKNGAATRKNQWGILSNPAEVGLLTDENFGSDHEN